LSPPGDFFEDIGGWRGPDEGAWIVIMMREGRRKVEAAADLALIAAAQRVENYEASAYMSARNLAQQLRNPAIVQLLNTSLAEEQNADQLLNQIAQSLASMVKAPAAVE
jgi:Mn-containing catalase